MSSSRSSTVLPYFVLAGGVIIVSTAAILIMEAIVRGVAPLTIAAGRLLFAALILTPLALVRSRGELHALGRSEWMWTIISGALLALHFASWISSLEYTSVASSTALVTINPLFVALASRIIFHEKLTAATWLGVALTIVGSGLIGLSDNNAGAGRDPVLGDLLALMGAVAVSGYFLVGRNLRSRMSLLPYVWVVYSTAAAILVVWSTAIGGSLLGLSPLIYLLLLGLAVGPQLLGHTAFNWTIRRLSATMVTVAILGEPVGSAILALVFLAQPMQPLQILGGAVLLSGIGVATIAERRRAGETLAGR